MNPFKKILNWYFSKNSLPYWCVLIADCAIVFICTNFTYWAFHKAQLYFDNRVGVFYTSLIYAFISIIGARIFHTYSGVVRYSSFVDLMRVYYSCALSLVLALILSFWAEAYNVYPVNVVSQTETVIAFVLSTLVMWGMRVVVKTLHDITSSSERAMRVLIYGVQTGGIGIAKYIRDQNPMRFRLCGFISHDKRTKHWSLMGKKVYYVEDNLSSIIKKERIGAVLVSPLRLREFRDNQKLQDLLIGEGVKIFISRSLQEADIHNIDELSDKFENLQLNEVSVEDLLPRAEIRVDMKSVQEVLKGKRVMITGSAGSIGSEIVRQVAEYRPSAMMLIDQAETPQHDIRLMMRKNFADINAEVVVTSICHEKRMDRIFKDFKPDFVFHAAAYKHVPMMEDNPSEAVYNNIYGTKVIADLSVKYGVKKFVMISTDKAVNPTNVMGCSKRICEIYVQSLNQSEKDLKKGSTEFVTTRFGNVLGSNGSVIPLFREQIKNGGPVTVTHPDIIRYFMLIPEACKLVLEAGTKGNGGEIFVFDMGKPVKIADLAQRMIKLSGAKNVEIKFTGLREGEKLYEEVLNEQENTKPTFHEKIRIAEVREYDYQEVCKDLEVLMTTAKEFNNMATVKQMKKIVPEYKSNNSVYEQLDK